MNVHDYEKKIPQKSDKETYSFIVKIKTNVFIRLIEHVYMKMNIQRVKRMVPLHFVPIIFCSLTFRRNYLHTQEIKLGRHVQSPRE